MTDFRKIFDISSGAAFEEAALELFALQAEQCVPYREYLALLDVKPEVIRRAAEIPHLPIELFRTHKVYCGPHEPEKIFTSSTTGGDTPSKHYVGSLDWYAECYKKTFAIFYGEPARWSFYALLPGYLEREGSSLVDMAAGMIAEGGGGFFLDDYAELIQRMEADPKPKILLGVSYALWDLAESRAPKLRDTVVMETGGMKGRRQELPKHEFHAMLKEAFGVDTVHSEYGMAELTSQAYSQGEGVFRTPPWMKIRVRDINDPFETLPGGHTGGINITDLSNVHSCAFIQTQDMGTAFDDGSFTIAGRIDRSQVRGCNLMAE